MADFLIYNDNPTLQLDFRKPNISTGTTVYFNEGDHGYFQSFTIQTDTSYSATNYSSATSYLHYTNVLTGHSDKIQITPNFNAGTPAGYFGVPEELTDNAGIYECYMTLVTDSSQYSSPRWTCQVLSASNNETVEDISEARADALTKKFKEQFQAVSENLRQVSDTADSASNSAQKALNDSSSALNMAQNNASNITANSKGVSANAKAISANTSHIKSISDSNSALSDLVNKLKTDLQKDTDAIVQNAGFISDLQKVVKNLQQPVTKPDTGDNKDNTSIPGFDPAVIADLKTRISNAETGISNNKSTIDATTDNLHATQKTLDNVKITANDNTQAIQKVKSDVEDFNTQVSALQNANQRINDIVSSLKNKVHDLENNPSSTDLTDITNQIKSLNDTVNAQTAQITAIKSTNDTQDASIAELKSDTTNNTKDLSALKEKVNSLVIPTVPADLTKTLSDLQTATSTNAQNVQALSQKVDAISIPADLSNTLSELKADDKVHGESIKANKDAIDALKDRVDKLPTTPSTTPDNPSHGDTGDTTQIDTLRDAQTAQGKQIQTLQDAQKTVSDDVTALKAKVETNAQNVSTNATDISNVKTNVQANTKSISDNTADIKSIKTDVNANKQAISAVQERVNGITIPADHSADIQQNASDIAELKKNEVDKQALTQQLTDITNKLPTFANKGSVTADQANSGDLSSGLYQVSGSLGINDLQATDHILLLNINENSEQVQLALPASFSSLPNLYIRRKNQADNSGKYSDWTSVQAHDGSLSASVDAIKTSVSSLDKAVSGNTTNITKLQQKVDSLPALPDMTKYATHDDLSSYVTSASFTDTLSGYMKTSDMPDLSGYAKQSDLVTTDHQLKSATDSISALSEKVNKLSAPDLSSYATKDDVTAVENTANTNSDSITALKKQVDGIKLPDMTQYALKSDIPTLPDMSVYAKTADLPDMTAYAKKTDLPDLSSYVTTVSLSDYAKKTDLDNYVTQAWVGGKMGDYLSHYVTTDDLSTYAKKSELPDTSSFETKSDAEATYAKKTDLPNLSSYATRDDVKNVNKRVDDNMIHISRLGAQISGLTPNLTDYAKKEDLIPYAKINDLSNYVKKGSGEYVVPGDLNRYLTLPQAGQIFALKSAIPNMSNYVSEYELNNKLSDYVTESTLDSKLSSQSSGAQILTPSNPDDPFTDSSYEKNALVVYDDNNQATSVSYSGTISEKYGSYYMHFTDMSTLPVFSNISNYYESPVFNNGTRLDVNARNILAYYLLSNNASTDSTGNYLQQTVNGSSHCPVYVKKESESDTNVSIVQMDWENYNGIDYLTITLCPEFIDGKMPAILNGKYGRAIISYHKGVNDTSNWENDDIFQYKMTNNIDRTNYFYDVKGNPTLKQDWDHQFKIWTSINQNNVDDNGIAITSITLAPTQGNNINNSYRFND